MILTPDYVLYLTCILWLVSLESLHKTLHQLFSYTTVLSEQNGNRVKSTGFTAHCHYQLQTTVSYTYICVEWG